MKTNGLYTLMIVMTITATQTYAMELVDISQKPSYKLLLNNLNNKDLLLNLPKNTNDAYDKIAAYCSHTGRCILQLTCKHFYQAASINNLDKLVKHNFNIGDKKEKNAFFKALIQSNNPLLITSLLQHAQKEAQHYKLENLTNELCPNYTEEEYILHFYLQPLLIESISQNNSIMTSKLKEGFENNTFNAYSNIFGLPTTTEKCLLYPFFFCLVCPCLCLCDDYVNFCEITKCPIITKSIIFVGRIIEDILSTME